MSNIYFISDIHYGHRNIINHRGFGVEEYGEMIIKNWNNVVNKKDTVWILGDLTMEKPDYSFLNKLKGYKKVVLGNHDKSAHVKELLKYVNSVCGVVKYKGYWISHIPIHPIELNGYRNIHGHVHDKTINDNMYINVSCDVIDYTPIKLF